MVEATHRRAGRRGPGRARRRAGAGRRLRGHRRAEGPARARRTPSARAASSRASRWWSASTRSPRPRRRRWAARSSILEVDPAVQDELVADVQAWRSDRDNDAVKRSLDELRRVAEGGENIMPATIDLAHAGGTTGEWAGAAARGVRRVPGADRRGRRRRRWAGCSTALRDDGRAGEGAARAGRPGSWWPSPASTATPTAPSRSRWPPATPAWRSSTRASASRPSRSRRWPATRTSTSIGLSILSGSHLELVPDVLRLARARPASTPRWSSAASSPRTTGPACWPLGVAAVYTPKDFELGRIMADIVGPGRGPPPS